MPTIGVGRDALFEALGKKYTDDEFQELCFEFGIELDEVVEEEVKTTKTRAGNTAAATEMVYKIEIPANRYDILCLEGLARALNVFNQRHQPPQFKLLPAPPGGYLTMTVEPATAQIRPYIVCAVLRNCTFDDRSYNSFLDLQDRMHHNICRRRTLVAIGTHDLDTIKGPFTYRAQPPKDIEFVPLAQEKSFTGESLFAFYRDPKNNSPLKAFLPIIESSPVYPAVYDAEGRVLSLPPIINGNHSRISAGTKNVLVECTCTDLTKGKIVLNTVVAMFSQYSSTPFSVEPMDVIYPAGPSHPKLAGQTMRTPDVSKRTMPPTKIDYIQRSIGLTPEQLPAARIPELLRKMMLDADLIDGGTAVDVRVPITRPDVMHACDVMEDVAVAYSFSKIPRSVAPVRCTGSQQPLSKITDLMRLELAMMGFTEALTFALCSHDEAFKYLRREDDGKQAVVIANPKTIEFQVCRTSLLPGLFKTLANNKANPLPWRLFEVSDTVHIDASEDVGASNRRRLTVVYSDSATSGFEIIHGLVDRVMMMLGLGAGDFGVRMGSERHFMDGRCAELYLTKTGQVVGTFGTVHPEVLGSFELEFPTSAVEIDLQAFLDIGVEGKGEAYKPPPGVAAGVSGAGASAVDVSDAASGVASMALGAGGDVDYGEHLTLHIAAAVNSTLKKAPADPFKAIQQVLFAASLDGSTPKQQSVSPTAEQKAYMELYRVQDCIDRCMLKMKKRLVSGPIEGVKFLVSDAGDFFTEESKKLKAAGGKWGSIGMTAEELAAKDKADAKAKREKEAKAEAERDASDALNAERSAAMEAEGKKVTGGLHKFDASEVDVHGGSGTADDFMDAFGF